MLKSQNGITLVALVVTVIVLIILATISISVAINGGLIGKTEEAKKFYENQDDRFNEFEQRAVDMIQGHIDNALASGN